MKTPVTNKGFVNGRDLHPIFINDHGEILLCGKITWSGQISNCRSIILNELYSEKNISIQIPTGTSICLTESKKEECHVHIIARVKNDECVAGLIIQSSVFAASGNMDNQSKFNLLEWIKELPPAQQKSLLEQTSGALHDSFFHSSAKIRGTRNLMNRYRLTKATYTAQQQADIEELFDCCSGHSNAGSTTRQKAEKRLEYILNINTSTTSEYTLTKQETIAALDKELYGLKSLKTDLAEAIVSSKYSKDKGLIIALVGNPGVGKTAVAKALAKVMNIPFDYVSFGSSSTLIELTGLCYTYDGSDIGSVIRIFNKFSTTHLVLLLDEYDKAVNSKEGNPQQAFNDMLSTKYFTDSFLGSPVCTKNTCVVLTLNSIEKVPEHILNRCTVIHIDDYNNDEKLEIVKQHILPNALAQYQISSDLIEFSNQEILYLLDNYCEDAGARDAAKFTEKIVDHILSEWDERKQREPIKITSTLIDSVLDKITDKNADSLLYIRNKQLYSIEVRREIQSLISKLHRTDLEGSERLKASTKLHCLVSLIPIGKAFTNFNEDRFYTKMNETHYGMQRVKDEIAEIFYCKSLQKKSLSSVRLLLVGEPGIGKSSIIKSIADALNAPYQRIALNSVSSEDVLKGSFYTYKDACPGKIVSAATDMQTTRGIIHLDEVDKLGRREGKDLADTLIDVLDNSSMLTDNFLGLPVDFSECLFIATANCLEDIPQVIKDRFIIINLDGYSREEKTYISKEYILPKLERGYCPDGVSLRISDETLSYLIDCYCTSRGVRDIEKSLERIVRHKLYVTRNRARKTLTLTELDIDAVLGNQARTLFETNARKIGF